MGTVLLLLLVGPSAAFVAGNFGVVLTFKLIKKFKRNDRR